MKRRRRDEGQYQQVKPSHRRKALHRQRRGGDLNPENEYPNRLPANELRMAGLDESVNCQCSHGTCRHQLASIDPQLLDLFDKWNRLPERVKTAIGTIVSTAIR
jgi:hypothetical protein